MYSLLPELGEYAATEFHPLQRLLRDLHVLIDGVHTGLDLFELFCARTRWIIISHFDRIVTSEYKIWRTNQCLYAAACK